MLIAWSGHRPNVFREPDNAARLVDRLVATSVAREQATAFVCGGQRGVDQWAARAGLGLGVPIHIVLPTLAERFTRGWTERERADLASLLNAAASVRVCDVAGDLGSLSFDLRNEAVVRHTEGLIVVWTGTRQGGTFFTICAARAKGIPIKVETLSAADDIDRNARGV